MDCDGILKACTTKVVPNNARIMVTSRDSMYSPTVVPRACVAGLAGTPWGSATLAASDMVFGSPRVIFRGAHLFRACFCRYYRAKLLKSLSGGGLLGFLLIGAAAGGADDIGHLEFHPKRLAMVGPLLAYNLITR